MGKKKLKRSTYDLELIKSVVRKKIYSYLYFLGARLVVAAFFMVVVFFVAGVDLAVADFFAAGFLVVDLAFFAAGFLAVASRLIAVATFFFSAAVGLAYGVQR
jgi:hypothetical protein